MLKYNTLFAFICVTFLLYSCKEKEEFNYTDTSETQTGTVTFQMNPYDTIDYSIPVLPPIEIDSTTFLGIHTHIFALRCAMPACHDGTFEPDFRTPYSAYATLVFSPVNKDTADFEYKVEPGDHSLSWLYTRITTDDQVLGRMPLYDHPLEDREIEYIKNWINDGAPDLFGVKPSEPNQQPSFFGYACFLTDTTGIRLDTARASIIDPFVVPAGSVIDLWMGLIDNDGDGLNDYVAGATFTENKIKFSVDDAFDFSGAATYTMEQITNPFTPFMAKTTFPNGPDLPFYLHYKLDLSPYSVGDVIYFKVFVNDNEHANPTEIPPGGSLAMIYLQQIFSFTIQ